MTKRKSRVTTRERLAIVEETIRLIRKPETWCKGKWQCDVRSTRRGDPIYAYCIDGALGVAAMSVLGPRRAAELGVYVEDGIVQDAGEVGELLSVRRLAYDALVTRGYFHSPTTRLFQDADDQQWQIVYNDRRDTTHKDVIVLLRVKLRELRGAISTGCVGAVADTLEASRT